MTKRIIYQTPEGGVAIIVPSPEALEQYGITAIALKDVPSGLPFKIIDTVDVPSDRTFRGAWEVDEVTLTDGVGADYGVGSDWAVIDYDGDGKPDLLRNQITGEYIHMSEVQA